MSSRRTKIELIKRLIDGRRTASWTDCMRDVNEAQHLGIPVEELAVNGSFRADPEWEDCQQTIDARYQEAIENFVSLAREHGSRIIIQGNSVSIEPEIEKDGAKFFLLLLNRDPAMVARLLPLVSH